MKEAPFTAKLPADNEINDVRVPAPNLPVAPALSAEHCSPLTNGGGDDELDDVSDDAGDDAGRLPPLVVRIGGGSFISTAVVLVVLVW